MTSVADQPVTLPTASMVAVAVVSAVGAGAAWGVVAWLVLGEGVAGMITGLLAGGAVAACGVAALLLIRPWRPRPLHAWPLAWMAGSGARIVATLAVAFTLYSATPYGSTSLWLAVVVSYLAALVGETRLYAVHMKQFAPPPDGATPPE